MMEQKNLYSSSTFFGAWLGAICGALLGAMTGALSQTWDGVLFGLAVGVVLGAITGGMTGALTARTAGNTGGVSVGAYTGMVLGGVFGIAVGFLIPDSFRTQVINLGILILQVMMQGKFEAATLISLLLAVIGTAVGAWVGGRNLKSRNLQQEIKSIP